MYANVVHTELKLGFSIGLELRSANGRVNQHSAILLHETVETVSKETYTWMEIILQSQ